MSASYYDSSLAHAVGYLQFSVLLAYKVEWTHSHAVDDRIVASFSFFLYAFISSQIVSKENW